MFIRVHTAVRGLLQQLLNSVAPKAIDGRVLTGPGIVTLMRVWVEAINTASQFPELNSFDLLRQLNKRARDDVLKMYTAVTLDISSLLPLHESKLLDMVSMSCL